MVEYKILSDTATVPFYATEGSAGFDLSASESYMVAPFETIKVSTGLAFAVPRGFEMNIRPRSGITFKTPLRVWEGTVDSDYRGEVSIIVQNLSLTMQYIKAGERIAQGVITPVVKAEFAPVMFLDETKRGDGGFGHTGK